MPAFVAAAGGESEGRIPAADTVKQIGLVDQLLGYVCVTPLAAWTRPRQTTWRP
jgi:hypothetical protein